MKTIFMFVAVCVLVAIFWPIAVVAVLLLPLLWLISLPFRLLYIVGEAVFALLRSILVFPARLLGYRGDAAGRAR